MLLELIVDLFREQKSRLLRYIAILSAASLVLGVLTTRVRYGPLIPSLAAWINEGSVDMHMALQNHPALVYVVFILPLVLAGLGMWECLRLFFSSASRRTLGYILAYPLPRWMVFASRVTFLAGTGLLYATALCAGFSIGQTLVSPQDTGWMIWSYLPAAFLLYIFYAFLTAAFVFLTPHVWHGALLGGIALMGMYLFFLSPILTSVNLREFSLLTAYLQTGWAVDHPSLIGLMAAMVLNILVGAGLWWLFDRADLD